MDHTVAALHPNDTDVGTISAELHHSMGHYSAYKQLLAVEAGWRDMKSSLGLRPVFHRREDRIRAHVQLCWLALLLIRVTETATGQTWRTLRHELDRLHLVTLATSEGRVKQRSQPTEAQKQIWRDLELPEPPKFADFTTT